MQLFLHLIFIEGFAIDPRFMLLTNFKPTYRCFCILAFSLYLLSQFLCILLYLKFFFCKYDVLLVLGSLFLTSARRYMFLPGVYLFVCLSFCLFVCLFVCVQHNSKSYGSILMKFSGISCYIKIWKWFIFERSRSKVKVKIDQKVKFT